MCIYIRMHVSSYTPHDPFVCDVSCANDTLICDALICHATRVRLCHM